MCLTATFFNLKRFISLSATLLILSITHSLSKAQSFSEDAGVWQIVSPSGQNCSLDTSTAVCMLVINYGTDTLTSIPITTVVNGDTQTHTLTGMYPPNDTISTCSPGFDLSAIGAYTLTAWTAMDSNATNDTAWATTYHTSTVSSYPYFEDFEAGDGEWKVSGANPTWELGLPAKTVINGSPTPGDTMSWVTGGLGVGNHNPSERSFVSRSCFDLADPSLPAEPWIEMKVWWESQSDFDGAVLQSTVDGGATWQRVGDVGEGFNWYNDNVIIAMPGGQPQGWAGNQGNEDGAEGWTCAWHPLPASLIGATNVSFRIAFYSNTTTELEGFAFDEIGIGVNPPLSLSAGDTLAICGATELTAGDSTAGTYLWSTGDTTPSVTVDSSQTLSVMLTTESGCVFTDTTIVDILAAPSTPTTLPEDASICDGDSVCITAIGDLDCTFEWSTGATGEVVCFTTPGSYEVTCTNSDGCTSTALVGVAPGPAAPGALIGFDAASCPTLDFVNLTFGFIDSYAWDFGDGGTSTDAAATHTFTENDTFTVVLTVGNTCGEDSDTLELNINCITGIDEELQKATHFYPNPNQGHFTLQFEQHPNEKADIAIFALDGKKIFDAPQQMVNAAGELEVRMDNALPGLYFVKVSLGNRHIVKKMMVNK